MLAEWVDTQGIETISKSVHILQKNIFFSVSTLSQGFFFLTKTCAIVIFSFEIIPIVLTESGTAYQTQYLNFSSQHKIIAAKSSELLFNRWRCFNIKTEFKIKFFFKQLWVHLCRGKRS